MKLFVWKNVTDTTNEWHSGAGVAVIAESLEDARLHLLSNNKNEPDRCAIKTTSSVFIEDPSYVIDLTDPSEQSWVSSDAGCC